MNNPSTSALVVALHWIVVAATILSLLTGIQIAADAPEAMISAWLRPITLEGDVHHLHLASSMALVSVAAAYLAYLFHARRLGTFKLPASRRQADTARLKWRRRNVRLYQFMFGLFGGIAATGALLYTGLAPFGTAMSQVLTLHLALSWALLGAATVHTVAQYCFGASAARGAAERKAHGFNWLMKILRPRFATGRARRAVPAEPSRLLQTHPMTVALAGAAALATGGGFLALDGQLHVELEVVEIRGNEVPVLDGLSDDPAWAKAPATWVTTYSGANLPGGESRVEVQAARNADFLYFRFRWQDPTQSLKHLPLQKTAEGWRLLHTDYDLEDEDTYYEDKFAVVLTTWSKVAAGVSHLGRKPLPDMPGGLSSRGLHYTKDGSVADMWQWKAVRSEPFGQLDDDSFGPPVKPKPEEIAGTKRYKGGYVTDEGDIASYNNFASEGPGGYRGAVLPKRLPADPAALARRLGPIDLDPEANDVAPLFMWESETVEYSPEADAAISVGTVLPGIVIGEGGISGDRGDVRTGAHWDNGWWTLEIARRLDTGSPKDTAIVPGRPVYLWVAVFDHSQTRHTRHMRPIRLSLPVAAGV